MRKRVFGARFVSRRVVAGAAALTCALVAVLSWGSAAQAENPTPNTPAASGPRVLHQSGRSSKPLGQLEPRRVAGASPASPQASPPGGGCAFNYAWDWVATYLNHNITNAVVAYNTQVVCTATGPGQ